MVKCFNGRFHAEYSDFVELINYGGWKLSVKMKDNWDAMAHLEYLSGLYHSKANLIVDYVIDNCSLNYARRIDVYISSMNQDEDSPSIPKHIQFINDQPFF